MRVDFENAMMAMRSSRQRGGGQMSAVPRTCAGGGIILRWMERHGEMVLFMLRRQREQEKLRACLLQQWLSHTISLSFSHKARHGWASANTVLKSISMKIRGGTDVCPTT